MSDYEFSDLKDLIDMLYDPYYLPSNAKIKLAELFEDMLKLKDKRSPEDAIATLKSKIKNELKKEISNEMKQKIEKLEQLEVENKDLQTKKDSAEWLSRAFEYARNTALNENQELNSEKSELNTEIQQLQQKKKILEVKNEALEYARNTAQNENKKLNAEKGELNTEIQQLQQKKKILEAKNEATEHLREKATYIAAASTGLSVGLAVYIALEHTTKLNMWLIGGISSMSAFLFGWWFRNQT